ncbi:MAG TPA: hypothetical protein VJU79_07660 [Candidatus Dormibacteraeota bacterium]|nr:hypothetical protein [Candidatus Dormibacteraeota bacterium]
MVASFPPVELSFAFFADSAVVPPDGKLYVLGGGFTTLALGQLPGRANFAVVAGFRFGPADSSTTHAVELRFVDADGKLVLPAASLQFQSSGAPLPAGQEVSVSTVTFLQPMFAEPGTYAAEFWSDGRVLATVRLNVEERKPPMGGPAPGPRPN